MMRNKLYMMMTILLIIFGLVACDQTPTLPTDQEIVESVIVDLGISFSPGDSAAQVTKNLTLPSTIGEVAVAWNSSLPSIISINGIVTRPNEDTTVTLTATLSYGTYSTTKEFMLLVKAAEVWIDPLEVAIQQTNQALSYVMDILFISEDESYAVVVKMDESAARVDALNETIYYETIDDVCYIYELIGIEWTRSEITCSEKGTTELSFISQFNKEYFNEQSDETTTYYVLGTEYYQSLESFLGGAITSNFKMTLSNDYIHTISFTMIQNSITFDILITLTGFNSTSVNLPEVNS